MESTFYRQLFLRRYALLLQKIEQTYSVDTDTQQRMRERILCLEWVDRGIARLPTKIQDRKNG